MDAVKFLPTKKLSLLIICLLTVGVYFNTLFNGYAIDDHHVTALNPDIRKGIAGIPEIFTTYYAVDDNGVGFEYRPLVKVTYAIEYSLFGENVAVSHLINLLFYLLNIGLLFVLLTKLFDWQKNSLLIFLTTLLFALLPIHTEVINNLKSRDELLQFSFSILCILTAISDYKTALRVALCAVLFMLALLSKLSSASLIILLPLVLYYRNPTGGYKKPLLFLAILVVTLGAFYAFSTTVFKSERFLNFSENPLVKSTFDEKLATSLVVLLHYLKMMLLPTTHSFYYGYNMVPVVKFSNPLAILSFLFHAYILYWAIKNLPKKHPLAFAILFYLLAIFPFSNIAYPVPGILGERFAYVATVGFSIAFAWLCVLFANKLFKPAKAVHFALLPGVFLMYYSYDIVDRNTDWKDKNTLYQADIDHLQKSSHANYLYAKSLQVKADTTYTANRNDIYNKALKYYKNVKKDYWESQWNIAKIYFVLGNNPQALQHINNAYTLSPENKKEDLVIDIVNIKEANGRFNENIDILTKYVAKTPQSAVYNYYLMRNHIFANSDTATVGRYARAVADIDKDGYFANKARGFMAIMKNDIVNNIKYSEMAFEQNPADLELATYLYNYYKNKDAGKEQYYQNAIKKQKPKATF